MLKLLINADDFGLSNAVNNAIDYCFKKNYIDQASLIVNMPGTENAVMLARENEYWNKIGLHINLIEGRPLTENIKNTIFCTNGSFNGNALKNMIYRFYLNEETRNAVGKEIEAQVVKYCHLGFTLMNLDSHEHAHTNWSVFNALFPLLEKYNIRTMRLSRNIPLSEIRGLKKVYKDNLNKKIVKYNQEHLPQKYPCIFYFGSQKDVNQILTQSLFRNECVEMMIHPAIKNDKLIDLYNQDNISMWLMNHEKMITRMKI